ncbi:unnamed protein product [Microthlaspi erraticum]|uniref:Uncharacterized protein n=1 Tax=Microthlaspi erraticum TaxID=1685480 RepID=A0A6D2J7F9_9BRAS|nr:unnamed protein product [Microthlaspi erraticum]CAA7047686.1 unnamed protein product [Microthlaspi erraticum]
MGQGAWRDLAHGSSSTGYAKEEGRSHLEDQLDRPTRPTGRVPQLDRPSFNSIELEVKRSNPIFVFLKLLLLES